MIIGLSRSISVDFKVFNNTEGERERGKMGGGKIINKYMVKKIIATIDMSRLSSSFNNRWKVSQIVL